MKLQHSSGYDAGVSPVVGVMLMLVVTIIIAAVVSAFSGGMIGDKNSIPQATIQASYSINDGLRILHTGGDPIPLQTAVFTIWDGQSFGPNVEKISTQVVNKSLFIDTEGNTLVGTGGAYSRSSFRPGDTLTITGVNTSADLLQPNVMPTDYDHSMGADYTGTQTNRWSLCIRNRDNLGNIFTLTVSDSSGNLIAKTNVLVSS